MRRRVAAGFAINDVAIPQATRAQSAVMAQFAGMLVDVLEMVQNAVERGVAGAVVDWKDAEPVIMAQVRDIFGAGPHGTGIVRWCAWFKFQLTTHNV